MVHLEASEDAVCQRLLERGRQDDNKEAITERFREYNELSKPILAHFESAKVPVHNIDAEQPVEEVHAAIMQTLGK